MNKREAKRIAEAGDITIGELKAMIEARRGAGGMSAVNAAIPLERALDIYAAAIGPRADDEKPAGMRLDPYSRSGRMKPTADSLTIRNILRDCA